jgi:hypothetical protein
MNKLLQATLVGVVLLVCSTQAHATGCNIGPYCFDIGFKWDYHFHCGPAAQAGPWYLYWPYEAHFQTAANPGGYCNYPYWPGPGMGAGQARGAEFPGASQTGYPMQPAPTSGIQPTGYWSQGSGNLFGR